MASHPTSLVSLSNFVAGDAVPYTHLNSMNDEIEAIESSLQTSTSYTPTWTNGSIGNGTLTGRYVRSGRWVRFEIHMVAGSTTTFGGGSEWTFSLPVTAVDVNGAVGSVHVIDTGTAYYVGAAFLVTTTTIKMAVNGATSAFTSTSPHGWANTDVLRISGFYHAA